MGKTKERLKWLYVRVLDALEVRGDECNRDGSENPSRVRCAQLEWNI